MPRHDPDPKNNEGRNTKATEEVTSGTAKAASQTATKSTEASTDDSNAKSTNADKNAVALMKEGHRRIEELLGKQEKESAKTGDVFVSNLTQQLATHLWLEEDVFYPACRRALSDTEALDKAEVENDLLKILVADLMREQADDRYREAKIAVLADQVRAHVALEEKTGTGLFAQAEQANVDLHQLASELQSRQQTLEADGVEPPRPVTFNPRPAGRFRQENEMPQRQNMPERDDQGRFVSDDDYRSSSRGRNGGRYEDDDRRYASRGRGRDQDEGRGWHGDSEGHSEAARRGWDERGRDERSSSRYEGEGRYSRSRDDDDDRRDGSRGSNDRERDNQGRFISDDDRYSRSRSSRSEEDRRYSYGRSDDRDRDERGRYMSEDDRSHRGRSSRYDDDDRRSGSRSASARERDDQGRFVSDDERSQRSRSNRYDEDDRRNSSRGREQDRGHGGWFGDSEGHSEASRRGWERGGHGESGWFGDSRGHSEASRRGWEDRR